MTVGALCDRGILLVCYNLNLVKRTVIFVHAMMLTLVYSTLNAHISVMGILHGFVPFRKARLTTKFTAKAVPTVCTMQTVFIPAACPASCQ